MPETFLVDTHAGRVGRRVPRPHHRQGDPARQVQLPVLEAEAVAVVVQRRARLALPLPPGHPRPLPHRQTVLDVLLRLRAGLPEILDQLLLRNAGALTEPGVRLAGLRQHLVELPRTTRPLAHTLGPALIPQVRLLRLRASLVPDPPAPVPLRKEQGERGGQRTQTEGPPGVPGIPRHRCRRHPNNLSPTTDNSRRAGQARCEPNSGAPRLRPKGKFLPGLKAGASWEKSGEPVEAQPGPRRRMSCLVAFLVDDDLLFEDEQGLRATAAANQWLRLRPTRRPPTRRTHAVTAPGGIRRITPGHDPPETPSGQAGGWDRR